MRNKPKRIAVCRNCRTVFETDANRIVFCGLKCRLDSETNKSLGECWVWVGHSDKNGYGRLRWNWREIGAHVASWECANGPVPSGFCVLHRCDNPACVNPKHLWLGTIGDNNRDRHLKGRTRFNPNAGDNGRRAKRDAFGKFMCGV